MVACGFVIISSLIIQPMWPIDEYAIIVRSWDWFIPIIPPIIVFIEAIIVNKIIDLLIKKNDKIHKGASFCHEDKIKQEIHEIEDITDGYQKWQGNLPNFSIRETIRNGRVKLNSVDSGNHIKNLLVISSADPNAWARKYLIAPSHSWFILEYKITGMNLIKFNSRAAHTNNQFDLEIAMIDLIIIVDSVIIINGDCT